MRHLKDELFDPKLNRRHKLVDFSESKQTTAYLLGKLTQAVYKRVLTVSSENRSERMPKVRANFDANFKEKANDYGILISTEVLAEVGLAWLLISLSRARAGASTTESSVDPG